MFKSFIVAIIALLCVVFMYGCASQTTPSVTSSDVQTVEEIVGLDESWSMLDDQRILDPNNGMIYLYHYNDDGEVEINTDEYGNALVAGMNEVTTNGSR